jgi:chemotaxis protein CheX
LEQRRTAAAEPRPTVSNGGEEVLQPFISAASVTLHEMAGVETIGRSARQSLDELQDDISAVVRIISATAGSLILTFPYRTASAIARRVLDGVATEPDDGMIRDCMGEIANVVAGQAKAMLAETPFHFAFSMPKVFVGHHAESWPNQERPFVAVLTSDLGDFSLRLTL